MVHTKPPFIRLGQTTLSRLLVVLFIIDGDDIRSEIRNLKGRAAQYTEQAFKFRTSVLRIWL